MTENPPVASATPKLLWQTATIGAIAAQTSRVKSFLFDLAQPFEFHAGQHVDVRLTAPDGYQAQRSYSIASAPATAGVIELAIERLDDGEVSPFFHDVALVGDRIELRGPIGGHFVWSVQDGGPLLLLGGGSGIVPLMSMLRERASHSATLPTLLLYSARSWDELIFRDELLALHDRHDGLELVFALTREPARRERDYARRVDAAMLDETLARIDGGARHVFVCGSNPFVETATNALLHSGLAAPLIRTERYGQ
ncbi:MAG: FAD-binding oxidoreductase [Dokdonella sp.]